MFNPMKKIANSNGIDIPIMYVYLAGRIAGNCIDKCLAWRQQITTHYADYKGKGAYPIAFLDALNSKEADSIDGLGLTSCIPPNLIYDKDILSVEKADAIVANMDDYMEADIEDFMGTNGKKYAVNYQVSFFKLLNTIKNRRPNWGTDFEVAVAMYLHKPVILIAGSQKRKEMLEQHPFMKRASVIVKDVDELLQKKWLNILYKSIASAVY